MRLVTVLGLTLFAGCSLAQATRPSSISIETAKLLAEKAAADKQVEVLTKQIEQQREFVSDAKEAVAASRSNFNTIITAVGILTFAIGAFGVRMALQDREAIRSHVAKEITPGIVEHAQSEAEARVAAGLAHIESTHLRRVYRALVDVHLLHAMLSDSNMQRSWAAISRLHAMEAAVHFGNREHIDLTVRAFESESLPFLDDLPRDFDDIRPNDEELEAVDTVLSVTVPDGVRTALEGFRLEVVKHMGASQR